LNFLVEALLAFNDWLNGIVWGPPMLILVLGVGLYFTIRLRFLQFTQFGRACREIWQKIRHVDEKEKGDISPFKALTTAIASTVGVGNIAGVGTAIAIGGPGAIFWMWVMWFPGYGYQLFRGYPGGSLPGIPGGRGGWRPHVLYQKRFKDALAGGYFQHLRCPGSSRYRQHGAGKLHG
jgi:hypothetical protein